MARESGTGDGWTHRREWVWLGRDWWSTKSEAHASKREDAFAATPLLAGIRFILSRAAPRGHGSFHGLCVSVTVVHATSEGKYLLADHKT